MPVVAFQMRTVKARVTLMTGSKVRLLLLPTQGIGEKSAGTPANRPSEQKAVEFLELSLSVLRANVGLLLPNLK